MAVLERLAAQDAKFEEAIEAAARELMSNVDSEEVAAEVREALELLQPEDVWDRSGRKRHGYVQPGEAAWEIFEEAMQPFRTQLKKRLELAIGQVADSYCLGILKGTYDFKKLSTSEFKDWALDAPAEYFCIFLEEWEAHRKGRAPLTKMRRFIEKHCPDYTDLAERILRAKRRS